jgi:hypothetical protein
VRTANLLIFFASINSNAITGYPRPDKTVRDYLTKAGTAEEVEQRTAAFLIALFDRLSGHDKPFANPESLADFLGYGDPKRTDERQSFFDAVIHRATEVIITYSPFSSARLIEGWFSSDGSNPLNTYYY